MRRRLPRSSAIGPMLRAGRRRRPAGGGYILSLVLLLVMTILIIGSLVGIAALRDGFIRRAGANLVKDGSDPVRFLGRPVDWGICEEPLVFCVDPGRGTDPDPAAGNLALVGVRAERFVTRNAVYYAGADCFDDPADAGDVFVAPPAAPAPLGQLIPDLPVGYLDGLETVGRATRLSYGVGAPPGFDFATLSPTGPGRLYRSADEPAADVAVASVWTSLAPDCALAPLAGGPPPAPADLATWEFTGDSAAPTTVAGGVVAGDVTPFPPVGSDPTLFPYFAQIGTTPSNGCNCATNLACVCEDNPADPLAESFYPANGYLEIIVSCASGDLVPDAITLNARKVSSNVQETGLLHVRASSDGFGTVAADEASAPLTQMLATLYTFDFSALGAAPAWSFRIHPERTGGNQTRFDARLDNLTFRGACATGGPGAGVADVEICVNLAQTLSLVRAEEVVEEPGVAGSPNLLAGFTPPFSIMPVELEHVPPGAEDAALIVPGTGTTDPGTPVALPDPGPEGDPPLPVDAPGDPPPGPPVSSPPGAAPGAFPPPGPEDAPPS